METASALKRWIKPALGVALLFAVLTQLQPAELRQKLDSVQWLWSLLALALGSLANLLCALRWRIIVVEYGQRLTPSSAALLYFQGITANTVFPGGIIGGDVWRTLGLSRLGMTKKAAAQTVLLDRAIGFWALCALASAAFFVQLAPYRISLEQVPQGLALIYVIVLLCGLSLPLALGWWAKLRFIGGVLFPAAVSLITQTLTICAFLSCLMAVRAEFSNLEVAVLCVGIFLGAVIPASIGGFGSRELASVFFLGGLGIQPEAAFMASVFFGLTNTIQGLISLPFWFLRDVRRENSFSPRDVEK